MPDNIAKRRDFIINMTYIAVVALLIFIGYKYLLSFVFPFVLAFIIVSIVNPLIRRINRRFPSKRPLISFILMLVLYVLIAVILFSAIIGIAYTLIDYVTYFKDHYFSEVVAPRATETWAFFEDFIENLPQNWQQTLYEFRTNFASQAQKAVVNLSSSLLSWLTSLTSRLPGFFIALIFTIMLSFFISAQYEDVVAFFKRQLSPRALGIVDDIRQILGKTVGAYISALFKLMLITFVELIVGFLILGVDHAVFYAVIIAIFDALPVFGVGTVLIPWAVVSLFRGDLRMAVGLAIIYGVIALLRNVIEPKVVGDKLGLNPIISIVAIYIGFKTLGVLGMIFMPILAQILMELHNMGSLTLFRTEKTKDQRREQWLAQQAGQSSKVKRTKKS